MAVATLQFTVAKHERYHVIRADPAGSVVGRSSWHERQIFHVLRILEKTYRGTPVRWNFKGCRDTGCPRGRTSRVNGRWTPAWDAAEEEVAAVAD